MDFSRINKDISREEWKFLIIVWLVATIIVFLPMVVGYFMTPPDSVFLFRPNLNYFDYPVYFSQIDQAKHGVYFSKDLFTQENQTIGVLNPLWSSVGILARIFSLPSFIAIHLSSFLLIPIYLLSAYFLISYFLEEKDKRRLCFIFFVFASGIAWWISTFTGKDLLFPTINAAELFTPTVLSSPPHFIASFTLLILIFLFSLYAFDTNKFIYTFFAGFCALFLFSFHPYHIYTVFGVLLMFLIIEFIIERRIYFKHIVHYIILLIFSAPPIIYYLLVFISIPVRHQTFSQNITLTPALWIVLFDCSAILILAILGVVSLLKNKNINKKNMFLIVWAITQFFLIYLPINTQKRLLEGLNIPIMILVTYGLFFLKDWLKNNSESLYRLYCVSSVALFMYIFCASTFFAFVNNSLFFKDYPSLAYLTKDDEKAMLWIKEETPEQSIIFSSKIQGNIIPFFASRPVYYGHFMETVQASQKIKMLDNFFEKDNNQERKEFFKKNNINYLFWGPEEKKIANNFNPDQENFLQRVYSNNTVAVYKID